MSDVLCGAVLVRIPGCSDRRWHPFLTSCRLGGKSLKGGSDLSATYPPSDAVSIGIHRIFYREIHRGKRKDRTDGADNSVCND